MTTEDNNLIQDAGSSVIATLRSMELSDVDVAALRVVLSDPRIVQRAIKDLIEGHRVFAECRVTTAISRDSREKYLAEIAKQASNARLAGVTREVESVLEQMRITPRNAGGTTLYLLEQESLCCGGIVSFDLIRSGAAARFLVPCTHAVVLDTILDESAFFPEGREVWFLMAPVNRRDHQSLLKVVRMDAVLQLAVHQCIDLEKNFQPGALWMVASDAR